MTTSPIRGRMLNSDGVREIFPFMSANEALETIKRAGGHKEGRHLCISEAALWAYIDKKQKKAAEEAYKRSEIEKLPRGRKPRRKSSAPVLDHIPRWEELHPCG